MPVHKYTPKPVIYNCIQYDGKNFMEITDWGAPLTKIGDKVYLGAMEVVVTGWVMKDIFDVFTTLSDEWFQKGYKPGGGP